MVMDKYNVQQTVTLAAGTVLLLSERQAKARRNSLVKIEGRDLYRATALVQFKAGEEIGLEGPAPKAMAAVLSAPGKAKTKPTKAEVAKADDASGDASPDRSL